MNVTTQSKEVMNTTSLIIAFVQPGRLLRSSVPGALQELARLCGCMRERRALVLRLLARLRRLWCSELQHTPTPHALRHALVGLGGFGELLVRFGAIMRQHAVDDADFRLMLSRQLLVKLQRLHTDTLELESMVSGGAHVRRSLEQLQFGADVRLQMLLDKQRSGYAETVRTELQRIEAEVNNLEGIRDAIRQGRTTGVAIEVDGIEDAAGTLRLVVAKRALDEDELVGRCDHKAREGGDRWLVRAHSACHLCPPTVFAFALQRTSSCAGVLEVVASQAAVLTALFYGVALALHAPHECELMAEASERDDQHRDDSSQDRPNDTHGHVLPVIPCPEKCDWRCTCSQQPSSSRQHSTITDTTME